MCVPITDPKPASGKREVAWAAIIVVVMIAFTYFMVDLAFTLHLNIWHYMTK